MTTIWFVSNRFIRATINLLPDNKNGEIIHFHVCKSKNLLCIAQSFHNCWLNNAIDDRVSRTFYCENSILFPSNYYKSMLTAHIFLPFSQKFSFSLLYLLSSQFNALHDHCVQCQTLFLSPACVECRLWWLLILLWLLLHYYFHSIISFETNTKNQMAHRAANSEQRKRELSNWFALTLTLFYSRSISLYSHFFSFSNLVQRLPKYSSKQSKVRENELSLCHCVREPALSCVCVCSWVCEPK